MSVSRRIVVGISGASGAVLGIRTVELLSAARNIDLHLIVSPAAERVMTEEIGRDALRSVRRLASQVHACADLGACIASGSFQTAGMIVAPCSIRTLSAIAYGNTDNLLTRAADVHLKERRPLVLMVRESPLHLGHIRAMVQATEAGAIVAPPVLPFYLKPDSVEHGIDQIVRRALVLLKLEDEALVPVQWRADRGSNGHIGSPTELEPS